MTEPRNKLPPIHPGEILLEEVMKPLALSANALARELHVPPNRITEVVNGHRGISADTALRLARYLGTTAQFWMNLQASYDLKIAERDLAPQIERDVHPRAA